MHLVCMKKIVVIVVCIGEQVSFSYGNLLLEIMSKMGGTPFGRQDFLVFSPPLPSLLRSLARLSLVSRSSLARLSLVSRLSLTRLPLVFLSSCLSLALLVRLTLVFGFGCFLV